MGHFFSPRFELRVKKSPWRHHVTNCNVINHSFSAKGGGCVSLKLSLVEQEKPVFVYYSVPAGDITIAVSGKH